LASEKSGERTIQEGEGQLTSSEKEKSIRETGRGRGNY